MRSALVAPPERLSRSRNLAVLLPSRLLGAFLRDFADFAAVFAFFARTARLADLPLDGATWRACSAACGLFVPAPFLRELYASEEHSRRARRLVAFSPTWPTSRPLWRS